MKFLKLTLYIIIGFLSFYVILNLFIDKEFKVSRDIEINASPYIVYNQINNLKNWENWDPWLKKEAEMKISYNEIESGVGASKRWQSKLSGNGNMQITSSSYIENVDLDISIEGWNTFKGHFYFESSEKGVKVSWVDEGEFPFLLRAMNLVIDKMMGQDFEEGLSNLKEYCESNSGKSGDITNGEWEELYTLTITDSCSIENVSATLGRIYGEVFQLLGSKGMNPSSAPYAQYIQFPLTPGDENKIILKAGVLLDTFLSPEGRMESGKTNAGKIISCTNYGAYETVGATYEALKEHIKENDWSAKQDAYEFYDTDPATTSDQSKWETRVVYEIN